MYPNLGYVKRVFIESTNQLIGISFMLVPKSDKRYQKLRDTITAARKAKGLHQADLAKKLKVSQQFISKVETGERQLTLVEAIEMARSLSIDIHALIKKL